MPKLDKTVVKRPFHAARPGHQSRSRRVERSLGFRGCSLGKEMKMPPKLIHNRLRCCVSDVWEGTKRGHAVGLFI